MNRASRYRFRQSAWSAALAGLLVVLACSSALPDDVRRAPDFRLKGPAGYVTLAEQLKEGPAIVLVWATSCPYCHALLPHLQSLTFQQRAPQILAVSALEAPGADPASFFADHGYRMTLLVEGDRVLKDFGATGFPALYVVDRCGAVRFDLDEHRLPGEPQRSRLSAMSDAQRPAWLAPMWAARLREALATVRRQPCDSGF